MRTNGLSNKLIYTELIYSWEVEIIKRNEVPDTEVKQPQELWSHPSYDRSLAVSAGFRSMIIEDNTKTTRRTVINRFPKSKNDLPEG